MPFFSQPLWTSGCYRNNNVLERALLRFATAPLSESRIRPGRLDKLNCGKQMPEAWATSTLGNDGTHTNQSGAATLHLTSSVNFLSQSLLLLKDFIDFIWCLMLRIPLMNRWMRLSIRTPPPQQRGKRRQLWEWRIGTRLTSYLQRGV